MTNSKLTLVLFDPTYDGYPDVDTYRDLEFYLISGWADRGAHPQE